MNNASEVHTDDTSQPSPDFPFFPHPPPLPIASLTIGLTTGVAGMSANAVVFVALVFGRRYFGSKINILITNQSAMDLFACMFLSISFSMSFPGAVENYIALGEVGNNLVCFLLRNRVLSIMCMNAAKIGLEVINRSLSSPWHERSVSWLSPWNATSKLSMQSSIENTTASG